MKRFVLVILSVLSFFGCAKNSLIVSVSPDLKKYNPQTFAIFPFTDSRLEGEKSNNAVTLITDSFETAFMDTGFRVVERRKIENVMKEVEFSHKGTVDTEQLKDIGKMTNADTVIFGLLRAFHPVQFSYSDKPDKPSKCTTISFSVKAIHIESGEILWKGSVTKSTGYTGDTMSGCTYDLIKFADKISRDVAQSILKKSQQTKNIQSDNK